MEFIEKDVKKILVSSEEIEARSKELAEMIDISPRSLSNIEVGACFVKSETLEKIIESLAEIEILKDEFLYEDYSYYRNCNWWDYGFLHSNKKEKSYIDDLKSVAVYYGYSPENIDELLSNGFSPEEVEEYIYYGEVCH